MGELNGVFWFKLGSDRPIADRAQQAATNFLLFSVDLVMAQVDRTMQILSGGYLNSIRTGKIRLGD
ncbi:MULTISPECIES: hypothetical protein [unclassified Microcoleus]|uniref:hypothetical protein n=1 Tax=unclassified Microcoleus TaxID=2642155 RepID=UPI002FD0EE15